MMRYIALKRHNDRKHEGNKLRIIRATHTEKLPDLEVKYFRKMHKLSKAKVHCSCPKCAFKGTTRQEYMEYAKHADSEYDGYLKKKNRDGSRMRAFA